MTKHLKIFLTIAFCFLLSTKMKAQASIDAFSIAQSNLISDLKNLKASNPKMSSDDFVKSANSVLEKQGINFVIGFDEKTCQKIEQVKKTQKNPNSPLNLSATLKSPLGEAATLRLPEANFIKNECFSCFITLPFLEVTDKDFVTIVQNRNLKFYLPSNFLVNEAFLVDEKDLTIITRKWKIPFKTVPLSISDDGNILFLEFTEPELADLSLMCFSEGSYQFYAKKDIDKAKKGVLLKETKTPNFSFIKFETKEIKQTVKFPTVCQN